MTLSLRSPSLDVIQHTALRSPDFPQTQLAKANASAIVFHTHNVWYYTIISYRCQIDSIINKIYCINFFKNLSFELNLLKNNKASDAASVNE